MVRNFNLPQVSFTINHQEYNSDEYCLALAGGRSPASEWLNKLFSLNKSSQIYCADKGLVYCLENNIIPKCVVGDGDSAGSDAFKKAKDLGVEVKEFPADKDDTDLQILLREIANKDFVITGIFGGRLDHLYSNIFSILANVEKNKSIAIMADDKEIMLIMQPGFSSKVEFANKFIDSLEAVSLLPLGNRARVSLKGVHWPLENATLELNRPYAISNRLENQNYIECECLEGYIGLYFSFS